MKFSKTVAALTLGVLCALPVLAQSSAGSASTASPAPSTQAATAAPDTQRMGAGPSTADSRPANTDDHRDYSWLGLVGLAGLLGLRRRRDDHATGHDTRTTGTR